MTSGWRYVSLADVAARSNNAIADGPFGSNLKLTDYVDSGVPVLQGQNVTGDRLRWFDIRYITEEKAADLQRSATRAGDIVLVKIGSIGYSAIITGLHGHELAIIPANLAKVTPDTDVVDTRYLHRWLTSPDAKRYLIGAASKTAQPALSLTKIRQMPVPLPPIEEQRRIATILDHADALRTKRREALSLLDDLAESIFRDVVTIGDAWPRRSLGELVRVKSGSFLPARAMAQGGTRAVYGGNGISGYHDAFMFDEPQVVIGRVGAYCGAVHVTEPYSWITDNALYVAEHDAALRLEYLAHALKAANLNQYASRSGQPLISGSRIYPVEVAVPSLEAQDAYVAAHRGVRVAEGTLRSHAAHLDELFGSLQQRAFAGPL